MLSRKFHRHTQRQSAVTATYLPHQCIGPEIYLFVFAHLFCLLVVVAVVLSSH